MNRLRRPPDNPDRFHRFAARFRIASVAAACVGLAVSASRALPTAPGQKGVAPVVAVVLRCVDAHLLPPAGGHVKEKDLGAGDGLSAGARVRFGSRGSALIALANRQLVTLAGPHPVWTVPAVTPVGDTAAQETYNDDLKNAAEEGGRRRGSSRLALISPEEGDLLRPDFFPIIWEGDFGAGEPLIVNIIGPGGGKPIWSSPPQDAAKSGAIGVGDASLRAALDTFRKTLPPRVAVNLKITTEGSLSSISVTLLSAASDTALTAALASLPAGADRRLSRALLFYRYGLSAEVAAEIDAAAATGATAKGNTSR